MNRIVVTGATSMLGVSLIRRCVESGVEVYAVIRKDTAKEERIAGLPGVRPVVCGLDSLKTLPEKIGVPCDTFFHFAWDGTGAGRDLSPERQSENVGYTVEAVRAAFALRCRRFIGAGSQAEYGPKGPDVRIGPDTETRPDTPYGASKLLAGKLALEECGKLGIEGIWTRIFSVYGIYEKESAMTASALRAALRGEHMAFTPAEQIWDYLFSEDAGEAFFRIGEAGTPGRIYCVASGDARPLRSYLEELFDEAGQPLSGIGEKPYGDGPVRNLRADIRSLTDDTGFVPQYTFREGIRKTLDWLRNSGS